MNSAFNIRVFDQRIFSVLMNSSNNWTTVLAKRITVSAVYYYIFYITCAKQFKVVGYMSIKNVTA
jgi:hypothetical protein